MISLAAARAWLTVAETPAVDAALADLIEGATATLGRELGWYLGLPAEVVQVFDGGRALVMLTDVPVLEGEEEEPMVLVEQRSGATWATTPEADYTRRGRALRHRHCWPHGAGTVRVTYRRGYAADVGPAELRKLVREMVAHAWGARGQEHLDGETLGSYTWRRRAVDPTTLEAWPNVARRWRRGLAP